jgi:hypothetical protein
LNALGNVFVFGRYLRTMAVSSAIDTHLHAISTHLDVVVGKSWMPMPASAREPTPDALDDTWSKLTRFYISLKQGPLRSETVLKARFIAKPLLPVSSFCWFILSL